MSTDTHSPPLLQGLQLTDVRLVVQIAVEQTEQAALHPRLRVEQRDDLCVIPERRKADGSENHLD